MRRVTLVFAIVLGVAAADVSAQVMINSFTASRMTVTNGSSATLSWSTSNSSRVDINNGVGTMLPLSGSAIVTPVSTTTYTLAAYPSPTGPPITQSLTITVVPPPQITSFTASPASITAGQTSTLSWTTSNSIGAFVSGTGSGTTPSGSFNVTPASTTIYTLLAYPSPPDAGPMVSAQVTVTVTGGGTVTINSFTASRPTITNGSSVTLSWSTSNASQVDVSNIGTNVGMSNTVTVSPTTTTTYQLSAYPSPFGSGPPITAQVTVTVVPPPQITSFTASPSTITAGQTSTLSWTTSNSIGAFVSGTGSGTTPSGSFNVTPASTTTYTLLAYPSPPDAGPMVSAQVTVTVSSSGPPVISSFTASPTSVTPGSSSFISWSTGNASRVDITNIGTNVALNGSQIVTPTAATNYTLSAYPIPFGSGPPVTSSITVNVVPAPQITSFSASPSTISAGQTSTLSWTTQNAGAVFLRGLSSVPPNGSQSVSPSATTTYILEAYPSPPNAGPSVTQQVVVTVTGAAVSIQAFEASRPVITNGSSVQLSWNTFNASLVDISNGVGTVPPSGTRTVSPTITTTYVLSAYPSPFGSGPPIQASVTVTVVPPPRITSFTANPSTVSAGQNVTLSWTTQNSAGAFVSGFGGTSPNGSIVVNPTQTTTYTLNAYPSPPNAGPLVTAQVTVTVSGGAVVINSFEALPPAITLGSSSLLAWSTGNASRVEIDRGVGVVPASGNVRVSPTVNTTYTLSAYPSPFGSGPPITRQVTVSIVPPARIDSFTASPTTVDSGQSATLSWATSFSSFVILEGVGQVASSGSRVVTPAQTATYKLEAYPSPPNAGPSVVSTVTVTVRGSVGPGGPPSITSFVADPITITRGASTRLSWVTANSGFVEINQGVGRFGSSGSTLVSPAQTTTYTLAAYPAPPATGAPVTRQVTVTVVPSPEIQFFTATPPSIAAGQRSTLSWSTTFSSFVSIRGVGSVPSSGSIDVAPVKTTTYTLEAYPSPPSAGEPVRRDVTVTVSATATCPAGTITLQSPSSGATLTSPITFAWSGVAGISTYRVWVAVDGASPVVLTSTSQTTATLPVPSGAIEWFVEGSAPQCPSILSARSRFTVQRATTCATNQPATLISPVGALSDPVTVRSPITFSWNAPAGAASFKVWLSRDQRPFEDIGTVTQPAFIRELSAGSYLWYIETLFPGCPSVESARAAFRIAQEQPLCQNAEPVAISPGSGSVGVTSPVLFLWSGVTGALEYRLYAGLNGADPVVIDTTTETSSTRPVPPGTVNWFVEAVFPGCPSTRSSVSKFTVAQADVCTGATAALQSPANGATVASPVVDFVWSPVPGAVRYILFAKRADDAPTSFGETTDTRLTRGVPAGATIEWWIVTFFAGCPSTESVHFTFTVPVACDNQRPIALTPADGAAAVPSPVFFSWTPVPQAFSYNLWAAVASDAFSLIGSGPETQRSVALSSGAVRWYVEAVFNGCPPAQSATSRFIITPPPPACGVPDRPSATVPGQVQSGTTFNVRWSAVSNANIYELQESLTPDFAAATTHVINGVVASLTREIAASSQQYFYRVRAVSNCNDQRGSYSEVVSMFVTPLQQMNGGAEAGFNRTVVQTMVLPGFPTPVRFTATVDKPWLTVQPDSGTLGPDGVTLTITADPGILPVGTNSGTVTVRYSEIAQSGRRETTATPPDQKSTVSVSLVTPVGTGGKNSPPPDSLIIPAVAHLSGANNSAFESDVRILNLSAQTMKYFVSFTRTRENATLKGNSTIVQVDPGATLALDDILETFFGTGSGAAIGALEIRPLTSTSTNLGASGASRVTIASSKTFNVTPAGTFGQFIPAVPFSQFIGKAPATATVKNILSLQQIAQSSAYRTNLGLLEGSGQAARVLLRIFNGKGDALGEVIEDLQPGEHKQIDRFLQINGISLEDGRIEAEVISDTGRVTVYASTIDNRTNDPLLVSPILKTSIVSKRFIIPGVALFNNGVADFRTDARLFNAASTMARANVTYYPQVSTESVQMREIELAPGEVKAYDNVLSSLFGLSTTLGGLLAVTTPADASIIASARTYNQTASGTFGQFVPGVTPEESAAFGGRTLHLLQLEQSGRFRTNVGLAETSGQPVRVEVAVYLPDSRVIPRTQIDMPANGFLQKSLADFGLTDVYNVRVTVKVLSGPGKVTAYASVIDQKTQDPTYVPAQ